MLTLKMTLYCNVEQPCGVLTNVNILVKAHYCWPWPIMLPFKIFILLDWSCWLYLYFIWWPWGHMSVDFARIVLTFPLLEVAMMLSVLQSLPQINRLPTTVRPCFRRNLCLRGDSTTRCLDWLANQPPLIPKSCKVSQFLSPASQRSHRQVHWSRNQHREMIRWVLEIENLCCAIWQTNVTLIESIQELQMKRKWGKWKMCNLTLTSSYRPTIVA